MPEASPELFVDAVLSFQKTAAIKAAVGLNLFTELAAGADTAAALAERTGASARGLAILCDFLTVYGFIEKSGERYVPTAASRAFLDSRSPAYLGRVIEFLAAPETMKEFLDDPVSYVRNGGATGLANMAPDNPIWITFAEAMVGFIAPIAQAVAAQIATWTQPPRKVLDIAAGHGLFGISVAQAVPAAQVTAVDWQGVLAVARRNAEHAGIAPRYPRLPAARSRSTGAAATIW